MMKSPSWFERHVLSDASRVVLEDLLYVLESGVP
jgi:hypothetical protein